MRKKERKNLVRNSLLTAGALGTAGLGIVKRKQVGSYIRYLKGKAIKVKAHKARYKAGKGGIPEVKIDYPVGKSFVLSRGHSIDYTAMNDNFQLEEFVPIQKRGIGQPDNFAFLADYATNRDCLELLKDGDKYLLTIQNKTTRKDFQQRIISVRNYLVLGKQDEDSIRNFIGFYNKFSTKERVALMDKYYKRKNNAPKSEDGFIYNTDQLDWTFDMEGFKEFVLTRPKLEPKTPEEIALSQQPFKDGVVTRLGQTSERWKRIVNKEFGEPQIDLLKVKSEDFNRNITSLEFAKPKKQIGYKVSKVLKEFKSGKLKSSSGKKVTDKKQALAIALSEARQQQYSKTRIEMIELALSNNRSNIRFSRPKGSKDKFPRRRRKVRDSSQELHNVAINNAKTYGATGAALGLVDKQVRQRVMQNPGQVGNALIGAVKRMPGYALKDAKIAAGIGLGLEGLRRTRNKIKDVRDNKK